MINFGAFTNHKLLIKTTTRSIHRECFIKKQPLKFSQYSQESSCVGVSFLIKLQAWRSEEHVFFNKTASQILSLPYIKEMMYMTEVHTNLHFQIVPRILWKVSHYLEINLFIHTHRNIKNIQREGGTYLLLNYLKTILKVSKLFSSLGVLDLYVAFSVLKAEFNNLVNFR